MEKFFRKQINRETATTIDVINDDIQEQEEQCSTVVSPSLSSLSNFHVSPPSSTSICTSPTTNSVSDQLALVMEQLKKMTNVIDQISLEKTKVQLSSSSSQSDDLEQMFQNITCSNDLYMLKYLEINSQLDTITCIPCFKFKKQAPKHLLSTIKPSFGVFEYVEQDSHQIQSQRFRSLKRNLKLHYENKLHMWRVEEDEKVKQEVHDFIRKNKKADFNIDRAALFCIQNGLGGLKFVHTLNLLDLCGASIGTYRHSRWFFQELRSSMVTSMKPVDPITRQQRPMGKELAANCVNVLESFGLTKSMLQDKLTGGAVDGAYIHMNINEHLCNNIGIQQNWLTISWDIAHLLELAIGDTQNQKKI
ncbi:unnamed protein product [Rotaria sordida]|uniref:Uncharacterized protein n=2 Tax=Rotaria sordida TaxID=392033 RepID=A0A815FPB5_9BILA|nr:unnamed protein product [Rotaria sordida]